MVNGGFERGSTPWTLYADTSVRKSSDSRVGRWALRVRAGAPTYYGIYEQGIVRTKAGRRFRLTAWVKGTVSTRGKPFLLQANERIAGIPDRRLAHVDTIMTTRWQHLVATGISRRRDAVIDVYAFVNGDIARGDSFLIDGVDLRSVTGG